MAVIVNKSFEVNQIITIFIVKIQFSCLDLNRYLYRRCIIDKTDKIDKWYKLYNPSIILPSRCLRPKAPAP